MNNIDKHSEAIIQIKVPLPFPLRWVNSYLIRGSSGYTLIDPGLHTEKARDFWLRTLQEQDIPFQQIEKIVLTHHHPDHYGLAGWFQEQTSAPVYMSEVSYKQAIQLWGNDQSLNQELYELFIQHGMDVETADLMIPHLVSFIPMVSPQPKVEFIKPQETITMGDHDYVMILAEGHAAGQLCFYNTEHEEIFCGDQVIPRISPNVSYLPGLDTNPLHSFLSSLEDLSKYPVKRAYPGHRDPFQTFAERAREIIVHHHDRLRRMVDLLKTPLTAYELCNSVFGSQLSIHQLRFAMAETLAHTKYLLKQGEVTESAKNGVIVYQLSS